MKLFAHQRLGDEGGFRLTVGQLELCTRHHRPHFPNGIPGHRSVERTLWVDVCGGADQSFDVIGLRV